jgi:hypothetical protein
VIGCSLKPDGRTDKRNLLYLLNRFHTQPAAALFSYFIFGPRTDSGQTFILSIERGRDVRKASVVRREFDADYVKSMPIT